MNMRKVPFEQLVPSIQPEEKDPRDVARLAKQIQDGGRFEPIEVVQHGNKFYIEDGNTRYAAAKMLGMEEVPVQNVQYLA